MSYYTKTTNFVIEFEDDKIDVKLSNLKRADYLKLTPFISVEEPDEPEKNDEPFEDFEGGGGIKEVSKAAPNISMSFKDQMEFMAVASSFLPKYVKGFKGLRDEDGDAITFERVIDEVYFIDIISEMVDRLFQASKLTDNKDASSDEVEKKSDEPQEPKH